MPLDARIRMGLEREASEIESAPDPALRTILECGPRRRAARTAGRAVALVAVVSTFVVGGLAAISATEDGDHRAANSQISSVSPIDGEWRVTLSIEDGLRAGLGYGQARRLAGRRDLELTLGVVRQIRPGSFDTIPVHGTFEVDGPFVILRDQERAPAALIEFRMMCRSGCSAALIAIPNSSRWMARIRPMTPTVSRGSNGLNWMSPINARG